MLLMIQTIPEARGLVALSLGPGIPSDLQFVVKRSLQVPTCGSLNPQCPLWGRESTYRDPDSRGGPAA